MMTEPQIENERIANKMRNRFRGSLRASRGTPEWFKRYVGCELSEFKQHITNQFQPGMDWSNNNVNGWHIDHIRSLVLFDLRVEAQRKAAWHYTNLQPLWATDNLAKARPRRSAVFYPPSPSTLPTVSLVSAMPGKDGCKFCTYLTRVSGIPEAQCIFCTSS